MALTSNPATRARVVLKRLVWKKRGFPATALPFSVGRGRGRLLWTRPIQCQARRKHRRLTAGIVQLPLNEVADTVEVGVGQMSVGQIGTIHVGAF